MHLFLQTINTRPTERLSFLDGSSTCTYYYGTTHLFASMASAFEPSKPKPSWECDRSVGSNTQSTLLLKKPNCWNGTWTGFFFPMMDTNGNPNLDPLLELPSQQTVGVPLFWHFLFQQAQRIHLKFGANSWADRVHKPHKCHWLPGKWTPVLLNTDDDDGISRPPSYGRIHLHPEQAIDAGGEPAVVVVSSGVQYKVLFEAVADLCNASSNSTDWHLLFAPRMLTSRTEQQKHVIWWSEPNAEAAHVRWILDALQAAYHPRPKSITVQPPVGTPWSLPIFVEISRCIFMWFTKEDDNVGRDLAFARRMR